MRVRVRMRVGVGVRVRVRDERQHQWMGRERSTMMGVRHTTGLDVKKTMVARFPRGVTFLAQ